MIGIFTKLEKQEVVGMFKQTGSRDKDVLATQKIQLLKIARFQKMAGTLFMVVGILASLPILTAIMGIPMAIAGFFLRRLGVNNVQAVESAYTDYVGHLREKSLGGFDVPARMAL